MGPLGTSSGDVEAGPACFLTRGELRLTLVPSSALNSEFESAAAFLHAAAQSTSCSTEIAFAPVHFLHCFTEFVTLDVVEIHLCLLRSVVCVCDLRSVDVYLALLSFESPLPHDSSWSEVSLRDIQTL